MTKNEAVTILCKSLGLHAENAGVKHAEECVQILAEALATSEALPTSWNEVLLQVKTLQHHPRQKQPGKGFDLIKVIAPINYVMEAAAIPFPKLDQS